MKLCLTARFLLIALVTMLVLMPMSVAGATRPQRHTPRSNILSGRTLFGTIRGGGTFTGTLDIYEFEVDQGQIYAWGSLAGTLKDAAGNVIRMITRDVRLPVTLDGSCQLLSLKLGPLHLRALDRVVDLSPLPLQITGLLGPDLLLGNLLCSIPGLLGNQDLSLVQDVIDLVNTLIG